ncbi:MBL fold metallo-hydrolase [Parabacteroides sp. PF5-6]|uniref:MBL fold metallo-hydrolase n=1 Tax=Parabacteroides sp. PF5-6 TaxID=1742403 RepID=UPI002405F937|nr:MBL fold metallo-hydrolase [Parabacteroides sp. PF5-6]MDF9829463.1 L-ascorbate metabolism protein UlaG (beta-lactamase superfamily) [Parabacteroides sp. PF5-6]
MRLIYIFHSGFLIEAEGFAILIDYYKDTGVAPREGYVHQTLLGKPGRLYVLSSHAHPDHFNKEILQWREEKEDMQYLFSRDILRARKAGEEDAVYLMKGEEYTDEYLSVKALGSTDIGISFLIRAEGKTIFHAGDLNNWHWKDESNPEEIAVAERDYLKELELLADTTDHLDVALFPVDPRLGTDFARGAEQLIDRIPVDLFAPMHFGENYDKLKPFYIYAQSKGVAVMELTEKAQSINI